MNFRIVPALAGVMLLTGAVAVAQTSEEATARLPAVVVVAPTVGESLEGQTVPVSITVISSNEVNQSQIRDVRDLTGYVPNLSATDSGAHSFGDVFGVRGMVNTRFFSDPALVLYVDDVPYGNAYSFSTKLYDVDSIMVLSGPQGSVFGKNSEAGVINIVTRQPAGERLHMDGGVSFGSYNEQDYRAAISAPLVKDVLSFGIAGDFTQRDGFLHNTNLDSHPDDLQSFNGRGTLRWTPADDWEITFGVTGEKDKDGVERIASLSSAPFRIASGFDGDTQINADSESVRVRHPMACGTITSITARRYWELDPLTLDLDFTPADFGSATVKRSQEQWTQELRFQEPPDMENWKWLAGLFFATSDSRGNDARSFFVFPPGFTVNEQTKFTLDEDNYAAFGQVTYTAWEKLDLTFGSRFDYTVKSIDRTKTSTLGPVPKTSDDQGYFNAAPKFTVDYRVTDTVMFYGSTGLGFKPGGFSAFIDPPSSPTYDTEQAWSSEIGVKTMWCEQKVVANLALFWSDIHDYQVEQSVPNSTDLTIVNAPEVTSRGVELELTALPCPGLQLQAAFGYTDAYFVRFKDSTNLSGNQVPFVPEYTLRLDAQYKHRSGLLGEIEWLAFGKTYYDAANSANYEQSSYGVLNARVGFEYKQFGIYVFGNNLTDTKYYSNITTELNAGVPGEPETVGIMATLKY